MDFLKRLFGTAPWQKASLVLKSRTFEIPYLEITGNAPGKTLLVTGGIDGDEYAGMEAVFALQQKYADGNFAGRLRLVPIVNMPGFLAESALNPLDQKFPIYYLQGKENGTPTERLMDWLYRNHISDAHAWYDAHGAAITEGINPFVWVFRTGVKAIDALTNQLIKTLDTDLVLHERSTLGYKANTLAKHGCHYVMGESGSRHEAIDVSVKRHISWIESIMQLHGMIHEPLVGKVKGRVTTHPYTLCKNIFFVFAPCDGIWRPAETIGESQTWRNVIGQCMKIDGSGLRTVRSPGKGTPLWWKETMAMRKGDVLLAVGKG